MSDSTLCLRLGSKMDVELEVGLDIELEVRQV